MKRGALIASVIGLGGTIAPLSAQTSVGFIDGGAWEGSLSYNALVRYDDEIPAQYYGRGSFLAVSSGGSMEGSFRFTQLTVVRPPELPEAVAQAYVRGDIGGPATLPELRYDEIVVESTSSGVTAELSFTAAELGNPTITMVPTAGGCGFVSGFWNHEFNAGLTGQGEFIAGREGTWSAHRNRDDAPTGDEYETVIAGIETDAAQLIEDLRAGGPWSADIIGDVLGRAEALAVNGIRRSNCDSRVDDGAFRSRAFATVAQLLEEAALSDGVFSNGILELMVAGYRSGVFAADPELETYFRSAFADIVDGAIESGTEIELLAAYSAAVQLGETDLAAEIAAVLEVVES